jgi:hypothetical protein
MGCTYRDALLRSTERDLIESAASPLSSAWPQKGQRNLGYLILSSHKYFTQKDQSARQRETFEQRVIPVQ